MKSKNRATNNAKEAVNPAIIHQILQEVKRRIVFKIDLLEN